MGILTFSAPLIWPKGKLITARNDQSMENGFSRTMKLDECVTFLREEADALGECNLVLYSNTDFLDVEKKRKKLSNGTGALLRIRKGNKRYVIPCDAWQLLEHNLYAIYLILRNFRLMERWGVGTLEQIMYGFEEEQNQLPQSTNLNLEEWQEALGLGPTATVDDATAVYHRRAKTVAHDHEKMAQLNLMMEKAREALKK